MSTPNPLIPQGSIQAQGGSNVRIAVATVVAIHVVFFGGLLLQGCKRDAKTGADAVTNAPAASALNYPSMDTNSLYYQNHTNLPASAPAASTNLGLASDAATAGHAGSNSIQGLDAGAQTAKSALDPWKQGAAAINTPSTANTGSEAAGGKEYTVVRGDTFAKIAKTQGSTVAAIKLANPGVDPAKIRPGMKLQVPAAAPSAPSSAAGPAARAGDAAAPAGAPGASYTVKGGDTLTRIAKNHGITVGQLRAANNLKTSRVEVGQKLKIPAAKAAATNQSSAPASNATF